MTEWKQYTLPVSIFASLLAFSHLWLTPLFTLPASISLFAAGFLFLSVLHFLRKKHQQELHQLTQQMQQNLALNQMMQKVAAAANEATSMNTGLQAGLDAICHYTGWEIGHAYLYMEETQKLHSLDAWHLTDADHFNLFRIASDLTSFSAGEDVVGEAFENASPVWVMNIAAIDGLSRRQIATECGIESLFAFPIFIGKKAVGVMEFGSLSAKIPDNHLLAAMANIGQQLGQVVERCRFIEHAKLLETVITGANDGVIITTPNPDNPEIVYVNEAFTRMTGYTPEEVIGKSPRMLQGEFTRRETLDDLKVALKEGKPFKAELLNYDKNHKHYWLEISIVPVRDSQGTITHYAAIERDISERKATETKYQDMLIQLKRASLKAEAASRDMQESLKKAEEANRAKSNFLANMSHELRTPMNGVLGMAHLLADTMLTQDQQQYVSTINGSAETLLMLLNDILDFSKIEAGALELENIPYGFSQCLMETASLLRGQAERKKIQLLAECDEKIPSYLWGDSGRLRQVMTNLIGNAVKFTEQGYVRIAAKRIDQFAQDELHITIEDTGIGIPQEKLSSIFDKFTQADTSVTRKYGGTGLGLAISRNLVQLMGGSMGVESVEGKGSTFWFRIPCSPATAEEYRQHNQQEIQREESTQPRKPIGQTRALLVEDTPVNQVFAQKLLRKFGFAQIDRAENGVEALQKYRTAVYDVVFMDCQMPELDGYQTTQKIRLMEADTPLHTPVIAMTANAMIGDREKCLKAGMDDYVSKPLSPDHLRAALQKWFIMENTTTSTSAAKESPALSLVVTQEAPPVDMEQLRMFTDGDAEEEKALIALFLDQAEEALMQLKQALETEDTALWKAMSHRFKGASGNFGAMPLHHLCKRAEIGYEAPSAEKTEMLQLMLTETARIRHFFHPENTEAQSNNTL